MLTTITIKLAAESKGELIDSFGGHVQAARTHFDQCLQEGIFGDPAKTVIRYLVEGGKVGDESKLDNMRGTPVVED